MTGEWTCHRCGADTLLAVLHVPGTWTNATGTRFPVVHKLVVCAACDPAGPRTPAAVDEDVLAAEADAWHRGTL
ncbi:DUF6300 family protein [Dactylosporangium sucinum]|uniref:Uncharacterized protein n=1 Tax=Dactylosporangium sucinum TaxID=1424081 RepID=A0A917X6T7_9ACTN|nr:DUF6300 family protein [Dactylosporangium sucinum]GGM77506.1 hypothetical protein GCM10007977_093720 [Dactylosporangium sucinum]GGM77717.1 hypothetical protein GCM10007977_093970 [Dactylosporangium sucinum]